MKRVSACLLASLVLLLLSATALGWGGDGHRIIATIAWEYLTPEARATVESLLKDDPDTTLADASTWADRIRSDHSYDWAKPLHYVSTLAVAPQANLSPEVPEDFVPQHEGLRDGYQQSKWIAER